MSTIIQANIDSHYQAVHDLFHEYLSWANDRNDEEFGIRWEIEPFLEKDMASLEKYMPPAGRLLLAQEDDQIIGCICLKQHTPEIAEVKRLYVRPAFRRKGIAKALVTLLLDQACATGYQTIRLDSVNYMHEAHALYHSFGFQDRPSYPESEIPPEYHRFWVFMERTL